MTALQFHPLADIFPLVEGAEFDELVADIREHGLNEPIVVFEDKILDGRNRYGACGAAGVEPTFTAYTGDDPVAYVVSLNLRRRHLDESQRAMVAAKLATLKLGDNQHSEGLPIGRSSELLNVGERTVARAREVQEHGTRELVSAVERGAISVSAAADVAALPAQEQREIVARGEREILRAAQEIRARKAEMRRAERIERLAATCNQPFPSNRRYAVIYADPPWHLEVYNEESGIEHAAANHYSTMSLDEIRALPIPSLASPDAALFMWTTVPHLRESFQVLDAWGFEYKTNIVWVKDKIGLGYFVRNQHELLPPEATCRRPHQPIARHRLLAHRAVSTAESLTKLTRPSSGCIPRCRRSSCSHVKRGRDGRRGETRWGRPHEVSPPSWRR